MHTLKNRFLCLSCALLAASLAMPAPLNIRDGSRIWPDDVYIFRGDTNAGLMSDVLGGTYVPRNAGVVTPAWMFGSYILTGNLYMAYMGGHQGGIYLKGGLPDETESVQIRAQSPHITPGLPQCGAGVYSNGDMLPEHRETWACAEPVSNYHAATKAYTDNVAVSRLAYQVPAVAMLGTDAAGVHTLTVTAVVERAELACLRAPADSPLVYEVYLDGTPSGVTVAIPAGQTTNTEAVALPVSAGVSVTLRAVATGAHPFEGEGVTVSLVSRPQ